MKIKKSLALVVAIMLVIAGIILEFGFSNAVTVTNSEAMFFLGRGRKTNGVYKSPNPRSGRQPFVTSERILAVFGDDARIAGLKNWCYVEEIGKTHNTALGFLPVEAIEILPQNDLKRLHKIDPGSRGFAQIGIGGVFSTYSLVLRDLNCDGNEEIMLRHQLAQNPSSPRITVYQVHGGRIRVLVDKHMVGDGFAEPVFLIRDLHENCSQDLVFFQPYGKGKYESGLTIYGWNGTEYEAVSRFTPILALSLCFQSYSGFLMLLLLSLGGFLCIALFTLGICIFYKRCRSTPTERHAPRDR